MDNTIWSIVPPVLAIIMVLLTKRVLVSLGVGIIASALFITRFNLFKSWGLIWEAFTGVFVEDGRMNTWNVYIILFVLILGEQIKKYKHSTYSFPHPQRRLL